MFAIHLLILFPFSMGCVKNAIDRSFPVIISKANSKHTGSEYVEYTIAWKTCNNDEPQSNFALIRLRIIRKNVI